MNFYTVLLIGIALVTGYVVWLQCSGAAEPARLLTADVAVRGQLAVDDAVLTADPPAYKTIIDVLPDREAAANSTSDKMQVASAAKGIAFAFVPVDHGTISDQTIDAMGQALAKAQKPVLIYCRSGNRASRVWALATATDPQGPPAEVIISTVRHAGYQIDDLAPRITNLVQQRQQLQP